ncbi:MAG: type II toxin-antitoxin system YafQ family toxin [Edaphobacter sp.]
MRTIKLSTRFKRDYKRIQAGEHGKSIRTELPELLNLLASDAALLARHRDHALSGEWAGFRDCHVRPDLVLIYCKPDDATLQLARLGSHGELFKK